MIFHKNRLNSKFIKWSLYRFVLSIIIKLTLKINFSMLFIYCNVLNQFSKITPVRQACRKKRSSCSFISLCLSLSSRASTGQTRTSEESFLSLPGEGAKKRTDRDSKKFENNQTTKRGFPSHSELALTTEHSSGWFSLCSSFIVK